MITCDYIKKYIIGNSYSSCFTWTYKGKHCGIDPIGTKDGMTYVMWYGKKEDFITSNWNELLDAKYFDGKTLREILPYVKDYDS